MGKFRAWLRLMRVAALPTALADVWLGAAVVGQLTTWNAAWLSLISLALYAAGMILNDVHDVEQDRIDNPRRPLPSGHASVRAAAITAAVLLGAALAGAAALGIRPLAVAGAVVAFVVGYDLLLKDTPVGPFNMGLCRAFNVCLGMTALAPHEANGTAVALLAAVPIFVYIVAVTYASRHEAGRPAVRRAVALALVGIIPFQAAVALIFLRPVAAGCILLLLVPTLLLRNVSHVT